MTLDQEWLSVSRPSLLGCILPLQPQGGMGPRVVEVGREPPGFPRSTWMDSPTSINPDGSPLKPYHQNMSPSCLGSFGRPRRGMGVNVEKDMCSRQVTHPWLDTARRARPRTTQSRGGPVRSARC